MSLHLLYIRDRSLLEIIYKLIVFINHYTYDAKDDPTLVTNDLTNITREMYWNENNRLMALSDNAS